MGTFSIGRQYLSCTGGNIIFNFFWAMNYVLLGVSILVHCSSPLNNAWSSEHGGPSCRKNSYLVFSCITAVITD